MPQGEYLQYGGQAIVEGVMMRSPRYFAVACRAPNQDIVMRCEPLEKTWIGRQAWLKKPFLRGSLALFDAMALGIRAMKFASNIQLDRKYQLNPEEPKERVVPPRSKRTLTCVLDLLAFLLFGGAAAIMAATGYLASKPHWIIFVVAILIAVASGRAGLKAVTMAGLSDEDWLKATDTDMGGKIQDVAIGASIFISMFIGIGIFVYLPNLLAQPLQREHWGGTAINLAAGLIKIVIFFGYLTLIGKHPEIEEIFKYHGAEHKAINTLEANEELTMENCLKQTRLHPRCGTSFAIIVLLLSVVVFTFVPRYPLGQSSNIFVNATVRLCLEVLILPFLSGTAYEVIRIAGKFKSSSLVKTLLWPGLMSQYITTREPEPKHIEVALQSLKAVVAAEAGEALAPTEAQLDESAAEIA